MQDSARLRKRGNSTHHAHRLRQLGGFRRPALPDSSGSTVPPRGSFEAGRRSIADGRRGSRSRSLPRHSREEASRFVLVPPNRTVRVRSVGDFLCLYNLNTKQIFKILYFIYLFIFIIKMARTFTYRVILLVLCVIK